MTMYARMLADLSQLERMKRVDRCPKLPPKPADEVALADREARAGRLCDRNRLQVYDSAPK